jgi:hypothetical protein
MAIARPTFLTRRNATPTTGLEWSGNETTTIQRSLAWLSPFPIYDATYIFRIYPKGPKSGATNPAYWTTFFWGNNGRFDWDAGVPNTFYGMHPYPFDGNTQSTGQNFEISVLTNDFSQFFPNAGRSATWNRWYTQVMRVQKSGNNYTHEFYFDYDLWISSGGTDGMFDANFTDAAWANTNPPSPCIIVGQAPYYLGNSWGGYSGFEEFKGIIRGLQFYNSFLSIANIAAEVASPGSAVQPWYKNLNPTPGDVSDKTGQGHNPIWQGTSAALWTA